MAIRASSRSISYRVVHPGEAIGRRFAEQAKKRAEHDAWITNMRSRAGGNPTEAQKDLATVAGIGLDRDVPESQLNAFVMPMKRSNEEVQKMLKAARDPLVFTGKLRLFDITGSSNDLLQWQVAFSRNVQAKDVYYRDAFGEWTKAFPTLSACCSNIPTRIEIKAAADPNVIVFNNLAYGTNETWDFSKDPVVPIGQMKLAPFYILGNIYGLRGVEVISHPVSAVSKCGGMESSNAFVFALHWMGSTLTRSGHDVSELFSRAVLDANNALGDNTGGQGISAMLEGGYHTFHYLVGAGMAGYLSHELVAPENYENIYNHIDLVQPGRDFGKSLGRTAAAINDGWCAALKTPDGYRDQSRIPALAVDFAKALHDAAKGDEPSWKIAKALAISQVRIRVNRGPQYLQGNEDFVQYVEANGGAAFPLGAGGPGAMLAVLGPEGVTARVRQHFGLQPITEEVAQEVLRTNGFLKGYVPYRIDEKGMEWSGFEEAGFGPLPVMPPVITI